MNASEGLQTEAVVVGYGVGDQGLDAGVTNVLKLLVVGRVHVGFMGVVARSAPADFPYFGEVGVGGLECGAFLKRVGGEVGFEGVEGERVVGSGDVEIEIAPGAPPERFKGAVGGAVGEKAVVEAEGGAIVDGVAVAFMALFVIESFGISENDMRAFAAGDGELGVSGGEGFAIEQNMDVTGGGDGDRGGGEGFEAVQSGADCFSGAGWGEVHVRQGVGDQAPEVVAGGIS